MNTKWILGIYLRNRTHDTVHIQHLLTKYGGSIKTRIGLHDNEDEADPGHGIILLELTGDQREFLKLENELLSLEGIEVKKMVFEE